MKLIMEQWELFLLTENWKKIKENLVTNNEDLKSIDPLSKFSNKYIQWFSFRYGPKAKKKKIHEKITSAN